MGGKIYIYIYLIKQKLQSVCYYYNIGILNKELFSLSSNILLFDIYI